MTTPGTDDRDWSGTHRTAVREAAPGVPALSPAEQDALWRRVEQQYAAPAARRQRWRSVVAGTVAVGVVGVAGVAAADVIGAFTGRGPVDAEDARLGGPGERLDTAAPDFAVAVERVTADIRFPSEAARASAVGWQVDDLADEDTLVSTGALRLWTSGNALCAWSDAWAGAVRGGDEAAAEDAADVILGARTWTAITDTDPRLGGESELAWLPELEEAVRTDDLGAARAALAGHGACMPGLAPELGLGRRW